LSSINRSLARTGSSLAAASLAACLAFAGLTPARAAAATASPSFWFAGTTLVLGAAYTLWLVKRVIFGEVGNEKVAALQDLNGREFLVLGVLAVAVLLVGLWPAPLLDVEHARKTFPRGDGGELLAIYHSHTRSAAYPSQTDVNQAQNWPEPDYVIISLADADAPDVKSYRLADLKIADAELDVD